MKLFVFLFVCIFSFSALAHDPYPIECCHERDCAPIIEIKPLEGGMFPTKFLVRTKIAWGIWDINDVKPNTLPSGTSHILGDNKYHACMIGLWPEDTYMGVPKGTVICVFSPTGG